MSREESWLPDVDRLRRRGPGRKHLIYLDQSVLSNLVREKDWRDVLELLRRGVQHSRWLCPVSRDHDREAWLAKSVADLNAMADELSSGVRFRVDARRRQRELRAAAESFLGVRASQALWQEAFETDPDMLLSHPQATSQERALPLSYVQNVVGSGKVAFVGEVASRVGQQRTSGRTFEAAARASFDQVVEYDLRPLRFAPRLRGTQLQPSLVELARRLVRVWSVIARHPSLACRLDEFAHSDALRTMPMFIYPQLLLAAAEVDGDSKLRGGDRYDIPHLVAGLSRCDVVTCDAPWARRCHAHGLVPGGCTLFSSAQRDELAEHLRRLLTT